MVSACIRGTIAPALWGAAFGCSGARSRPESQQPKSRPASSPSRLPAKGWRNGWGTVVRKLLRQLSVPLALCASVCVSIPAAALSPEFQQLLNDIKVDALTFEPKQGPELCRLEAQRRAHDAIRNALTKELVKVVVVEPLEKGAKAAIGALGGLAATEFGTIAEIVASGATGTYDVMKCVMDTDDPRSFGACFLRQVVDTAAGEVAGRTLGAFGQGEAGEAQQLGKALGAVGSPFFSDKAKAGFDAAKAALEGYRGQSETFSSEGGTGNCTTQVTARWNRKPRPGARGGEIIVFVRVVCPCEGASPSRLKSTSFQLRSIPVKYVPAQGNKPGWRANAPGGIRMEYECCSGIGFAGLYRSDGRLEDVPRPGTPAQPPARAPTSSSEAPRDNAARPEPVKELPPQIFTISSPCPECQPIAEHLNGEVYERSLIQGNIDEQGKRLQANLDEQAAFEKDRAPLEQALADEEGVGASSRDTETGEETTSVDQGDGSVKITVRDEAGNIVRETSRQRRSTTEISAKLDELDKNLAEKREQEARQRSRLERLGRRKKEYDERIDVLQRALEECVVQICNKKINCPKLMEQVRALDRIGRKDLAEELRGRAFAAGCKGGIKTEIRSLELINPRAISGFTPFNEPTVRENFDVGGAKKQAQAGAAGGGGANPFQSNAGNQSGNIGCSVITSALSVPTATTVGLLFPPPDNVVSFIVTGPSTATHTATDIVFFGGGCCNLTRNSGTQVTLICGTNSPACNNLCTEIFTLVP